MITIGYKANLISTIVDKPAATDKRQQGYKANLISTIVDLNPLKKDKKGYKANLISTIVDHLHLR